LANAKATVTPAREASWTLFAGTQIRVMTVGCLAITDARTADAALRHDDLHSRGQLDYWAFPLGNHHVDSFLETESSILH